MRETDLGFIERMLRNAGAVGIRTEAASAKDIFKPIAVVTWRLSLSQPEDVSETKGQRRERDSKRDAQRHFQDDEQEEERGDGRADAAHQPPEETAFQTPCAACGIGRGVGVRKAKIGLHGGSRRQERVEGGVKNNPTHRRALGRGPNIFTKKKTS